MLSVMFRYVRHAVAPSYTVHLRPQFSRQPRVQVIIWGGDGGKPEENVL